MNHNQTAALAWLTKQRSIIPIDPHSKRPLILWKEFQSRLPTNEEVMQWWARWPNAKLGLVCGAISDNLAVLDVDDVELGVKLLEQLQKHCPVNQTPSGGLHIFFREEEASNSGPLVPGVADIKAEAGYVIVPPSEGYQKLNDIHEPLSIPSLREYAETLLAGHGHTVQTEKPKIDLSEKLAEGSRNETLTRIAGQLRRDGMNENDIYETITSVNDKRCDPALPDDEVRAIARSVSRYEPKNNQKGKTEMPIIINLEDVQREEVEWLWQDRIPLGKITLIEGDPGVGKSWITMAIAAAVTTGAKFPDDDREREPASVLILSAEDGAGDTIRPRLEDMGAELTKIRLLNGVYKNEKEEHFSITDDIKLLDKALAGGEYGLVIIDPINAYLGVNIDSHKDTALRSALMPLAKLADKYNVAMECVRHLTKGSKDRAIYRGQGSIAYTAAARVVHLVGIDPNDPAKRAIIPIKNNLAPLAPGVEYVIGENGFTWGQTTTLTADMLLGPSENDLAPLALDEAKEFILGKLEEGECEAAQIFKEAASAGISERTIKRAKADNDLAPFIETVKIGFGGEGRWVWRLKEKPKSAKNPDVTGKGTHSNARLLDDVKEVFGADMRGS